MKNFKDYLRSQDKSKSTAERYNRSLLDFIGWLDKDNTEIENITPKEVMAYLDHLQKKGNSNRTRAIHLNIIKQFFNWQIELENRRDNPVLHIKIRGVKRQKLYPVLSPQELQQLYDNYTIPQENDPMSNRNWFTNYRLSRQRNKAILSLIINQGLNTAEIKKITVSDLRLREGEITIKGQRKGNERTLKLKSNQIIDLMEYSYQVRPRILDYHDNKEIPKLFLSVPAAGKKKAKGSLDIWKRLAEELREQNNTFINFQQVRTSVITKWLKQYNLREVQYMAGHRHVNTTEKYLVNQTEDLLADIDQFHPF